MRSTNQSSGSDLRRLGRDPAQHPAKDEMMQRVERVPVNQTRQAGRIEDRRLANGRAGFFPSTSNSSQALPGSFISAASRKDGRLERFDAPTIERLSGPQPFRIATPAPQPDAADQQIQKPSDPPQPIAVVPAGLAAYAPNRFERPGWIAPDCATCDSTNREPKRTPPQLAGRPPEENASDHRVSAKGAILIEQSPGYRLPNPARPNAEDLQRHRISHHGPA